MEPIELIKLLGRNSLDGVVDAALKKFGMLRNPQVRIDNEDADGPVVEVQDWVINSQSGIEFGFEDEASFCGDDPVEYGIGSMMLTQIYLYGEHEGVNAYQDQLPYGLLMSDDRSIVCSKMTTWESTRRSYVRDVWELPECRMTVSYVKDGEHIGFILLWSRRNALPPRESLIILPDIQDIINSLGEVVQSPVVRNVFQQFPLKQSQEDKNLYIRFNLREEYGIELRFMDNLGLSHVVFYREHEMNARGWQGLLPHTLEFNDSPEVLLNKMGQPPDIHNDELFAGSALWDYGRYYIKVSYCTMKNYILTVELLVQGVSDVYNEV